MKTFAFSRWLVAALVAVLVVTPSVRAADAPVISNLPDLGDESGAVLTPQDERRMGEDFMRQARAQLDILDDPVLNDYLQRLGRRLTTGAGLAKNFRFFLVNNSTINAFAIPGGFVGVHTGLLLAVRNEGELAAVLAHETAHITQRHIPRMIAESQRATVPTLAAVLAGILLAASSHSGQAGEATVAMATAGAAQHQLNFTRGFEEEADRIGMNILNASGYDARDMPEFFVRMEKLTRVYDSNLPEFLRTHPVTEQRIADSYNHADHFPHRTDPSSFDLYNMQARTRALLGSPEETVKAFRRTIESGSAPNANAEHYGLALALLAAHQYPQAEQQSNALSKSNPSYMPYYLLRADIQLAKGQTAAGIATYAEAMRRFPGSLAVTQGYADVLINAGRPGEAQALLDKAVREQPDEPALYRLLAKAAGEAGNPMESHRAFGEYYYLTGQPRAAIEQLQIAIRHANNNFYYVSSIEARIKEIRDQNALPPGKDQSPDGNRPGQNRK
jgi:predicted Zn-dependent protease